MPLLQRVPKAEKGGAAVVFFIYFRGTGNTVTRAFCLAPGMVASEAFFAAKADHYRRGYPADNHEPLADARNIHSSEAVLRVVFDDAVS